jgi:hypothetical protein
MKFVPVSVVKNKRIETGAKKNTPTDATDLELIRLIRKASVAYSFA